MTLSVLLVDDTAFLRSMLREILESTGSYRVVAEASDGVAALTLQPELHPDLIVSDLIMPGLDGIEMTRALVGADPSVRIFIAAAADQEGAVLEALAAGARDFLPKPFSAPRVLQGLEEPPPPPDSTGSPEADLLLRVDLDPAAPLPTARRQVLLSRCRLVGTLREVVDSSRHLQIHLRTNRSLERVRAYLEGLPDVAAVSVEALAAPADTAAVSPLPGPAGSTPGTLRVRSSLFDRLLDRVEGLSATRDRLEQELGRPPLPPAVSSGLAELHKNLSDLRIEILSARLVPFDRIALRLRRTVEEAARQSSRQASLAVKGGETRVDLAVLEQVSALIDVLLPRVVEAGIQRSDILRQLGQPEEGEVRLTVSRSGPTLTAVLTTRDSEGTSPPELDEETRDRVRRLGGRIGTVQDRGTWRIELVAPAGVSLVRTYLCRAGGRLFAVPVGSVEKSVDLDARRIRIREGRSVWEEGSGEAIPVVRFARAAWVAADGESRRGIPALVYRVGPQRYALAVDAVLGESEVVLKPLKGEVADQEVMGTALLSDGAVAAVPDLPHLARIR